MILQREIFVSAIRDLWQVRPADSTGFWVDFWANNSGEVIVGFLVAIVYVFAIRSGKDPDEEDGGLDR